MFPFLKYWQLVCLPWISDWFAMFNMSILHCNNLAVTMTLVSRRLKYSNDQDWRSLIIIERKGKRDFHCDNRQLRISRIATVNKLTVPYQCWRSWEKRQLFQNACHIISFILAELIIKTLKVANSHRNPLTIDNFANKFLFCNCIMN